MAELGDAEKHAGSAPAAVVLAMAHALESFDGPTLDLLDARLTAIDEAEGE